MDPISGVASIFAIVSLAVQLAETAINIKTFFDSILDAPAEVRRLKSSISLLIDISENINNLLNRQKCQGVLDLRLFQSIYHNLKFCKDKLDSIKNVLSLVNTAEQNASPLSRGWAHIRLACKKEQLEDFANQLDQAIAILGTNLAINLSHLQLTAISGVTDLSERLTVLSNTLVLEKPLVYALADRPYDEKKNSPKSYALLPSYHSKSLPGIFREWRRGRILQLRYSQVSGERTRYSISAIIRLCGLLVVQVQINIPDLTNSLLCSSLISLRNLIPHDAAIISACKTGNSTRVEQLFASRKARPNDATLDNSTALSTAIKHDQIEIVQLLLRVGADPNLPAGRLQDSPIQIAVARNKSQIARLLLNYGADLHYCSAGSWSILHHLFNPNKLFSNNEYYSIFGDTLIFDDIRDPKGWTALHRCAAFGTANDVYKLVELGASSLANGYVTLWGRCPLHIAAIMNNVSTLEALADISIGGHNTHDGDAQQRAILEIADINGWTPLHLAIYSRAMNTAKWLLGKKVDVHKRTYRTAIWFPENQTNETFSVMDVANMAGEKVLEVFPSLLVDAGYDITTDGSEIYW